MARKRYVRYELLPNVVFLIEEGLAHKPLPDGARRGSLPLLTLLKMARAWAEAQARAELARDRALARAQRRAPQKGAQQKGGGDIALALALARAWALWARARATKGGRRW